MKITIIYGRAGCGKTRNAERFKAHFGAEVCCDVAFDRLYELDFLQPNRRLAYSRDRAERPKAAILLTNDHPRKVGAKLPSLQKRVPDGYFVIRPFESVMAEMDAKPTAGEAVQ